MKNKEMIKELEKVMKNLEESWNNIDKLKLLSNYEKISKIKDELQKKL